MTSSTAGLTRGPAAQHLICRCAAAVEADRKVLIGFRLGDI
jgi:hypothetical protein